MVADIRRIYIGAYPPNRYGIPHDRSTIKGPPSPSNNSIHNADCKKSRTMPDFAAVKELVEQQESTPTDAQGASMVQALAIRRPLPVHGVAIFSLGIKL